MPRSVVLCVGSVNADLTLLLDELPRPGETRTVRAIQEYAGGKGANQAVAAARLGANVRLIGAVGNDQRGRRLLDSISSAGVEVAAVAVHGGETGSAYVLVDNHGENSIAVHPGANAMVRAAALTTKVFEGAVVLATCLELDDEVVFAAARRAKSYGLIVVVTFAPARESARPVLADTDVLVVNEHELAVLAGGAPDYLAARAELGVPSLVVTLGARGAVVVDGPDPTVVRMPGVPVRAVDTTGCGDAFTGAVLAGLAAGDTVAAAARSAVTVGALAATRHGAQPSFPTRAELAAFQDGAV